jgi:hypothetical protein
MTNIDNPRGLEWVDDTGGSATLQPYDVSAANATVISRNDPITLLADGTVRRSNNTDGAAVAAVVVTIQDVDGNNLKQLPALTAGTLGCRPVKTQVFQIQSATGITLNAADVNNTFNFVEVDGDPISGISKYEIGSIGTGNQGRIISKVKSVGGDNEFGEEHVNLRVALVQEAYSDTTAI